jgi:hypothetical protein
MTRSLTPSARTLRRLSPLAIPAMLVLAGCGQQTQAQFAPPCPTAQIVPEGGDLQRWRGDGRDITDAVLDAHISGLNGQCSRDSARITKVKVTVNFTAHRGPANPGRVADLGYFIAVAEGTQILDRQAYPLHIVFPPNQDNVYFHTTPITLNLPVTQQKTAAAYTVWTGLTLTPAELAANQQRAAAGQPVTAPQ